MSKLRRSLRGSGILMFAAALALRGQEARKATAPPRTSPTKPIRYAKRGLPARRVGSAVRGAVVDPLVRVLAPQDHVAQTLTDAPILYWVLLGDSTTAPRDAELTVVGGGQTRRVKLEPVQPWTAAAIDLGALGLRLRPGVEYVWTVRLGDARELADSAWIRIAPAGIRRHLVNSAHDIAFVRALAENGVWYDAVSELERIAHRTGEDGEQARLLRDGLLERELHLPPLKR